MSIGFERYINKVIVIIIIIFLLSFFTHKFTVRERESTLKSK